MTRLAVLAVVLALGLPAAASAQTVIVPAEGPVTIDEARSTALDYGMRQIEDIEFNREDQRWEVDGRDLNGRWTEMDIDSNTGAVTRIDR